MHVQDTNYYPLEFKSFKVTSEDGNGNPLITEFYKNENESGLVFPWTQTWNANDKCTSWKVDIEE